MQLSILFFALIQMGMLVLASADSTPPSNDQIFQMLLDSLSNKTFPNPSLAPEPGNLRGHELNTMSSHHNIDLEAKSITLPGFLSTNAYSDSACKKLMVKVFYQVEKCVSYQPVPGAYVMLRLYPQPLYKRFVGIAQQYSDAQCQNPIKVIDTQYFPHSLCLPDTKVAYSRFPSLNFPMKGDYSVISLYETTQQCSANNPSDSGLLLGLYSNANSCYTTGTAYDVLFKGCDKNGNLQIALLNAGKTPCSGNLVSTTTVTPGCSTKGNALLGAFGYGGYINVYCKKSSP